MAVLLHPAGTWGKKLLAVCWWCHGLLVVLLVVSEGLLASPGGLLVVSWYLDDHGT